MHVKEKYPEARDKIFYMDVWSSFHLSEQRDLCY